MSSDEVKRLKAILTKKNEKLRKLKKKYQFVTERCDRLYDSLDQLERNQWLIRGLIPEKFYKITFNALSTSGGMGEFVKLEKGFCAQQVVEMTRKKTNKFNLLWIEEIAS